ncbi:MAG TPA: sugar phosphate isomerase/epimerase family protein [Chloroflexota bacterium]|nr:sugar phosphate isomerase/epimerase family protein [Chloroflexota bacterium]
MAISLGLRLPGVLRSLPLAEVAALAQDVGLDALDLPADSAAIEACRTQGIGIGTVDGIVMGELVSADDAERGRAVTALCEQIGGLAKTGVHTLFLCLVPKSNEQSIAQSLDYFKDSFPTVAKACEAAGTRIAFEGWPGPTPYHHTLGYTPEVWRAMFDAVPSSALGLCYDPSHLVRLGIDYLRVLEEFRERIHHCHGKDTALLSEGRYLYGQDFPALDTVPRFSGGAWRYCVPGAGTANWAMIADALERAGYDGCVSIELEDRRYTGSVENEQRGIRAAYAHLASHFR